jgi:SWIM zinc finger
MTEAEYAPQKINDNHWIVYKFETQHWKSATYYEVIKGANGWFCTCKASHGCKHLKMVLNEINPKKELF